MPVTRAEIVVIGGGPAGAAAASLLAEAGRDVLVLERSPGPVRKVCGEFLSAETLAALRRLGLEARSLGAAPIKDLRLTAGGAVAEARLPFPAVGLSRETLDLALLGRCLGAGARLCRGVSARGITPGSLGLRVLLSDGGEIRTGRVLVATGKSELPGGGERVTSWPGRARMLGLKAHLRLEPEAARRLGSAIELHFFRGGCAGLQPVDGGADHGGTNLCITLSRDAYAQADTDFRTLLRAIGAENAHFAAALEGATLAEARPLAIARVPYGYRRRPAGGSARLWWLGDQMAVTASFTGDGLAFALESGIAAAHAIIANGSRAAYETGFAARAARQVGPAMLLQGLVDRPWLHRPAVRAARLRPGVLRWVARQTRLPSAPGHEADGTGSQPNRWQAS